MSTLKINLANFFAKQSCSAWQKNRIVRKICRDTYRLIMETGAANYPYANSDFANWPESDGDSYTLVTDSSNFVIRHSASYIAWMMKKKRMIPKTIETNPTAKKYGTSVADE